MSDYSQIQAVLFDLDGTLLDTYKLIIASMHHAMITVFGQDESDEYLSQFVGQPLDTQMVFFAHGDKETGATLARVYRDHNDMIHDKQVRAFEGAKETLAELKSRGYRLGLVTSKRHELAQRGLEICELLPYMEFVQGPDDWPETKPSAGAVAHGCETLGLAPEVCAYVGDSPFDMQSATGAGVLAVGAEWGMFGKERLNESGADIVLKDIRDLLELFK